MAIDLPERINLADWFLESRVLEGHGERTALITDDGALTYDQVLALANRFGNALLAAGVEPEQRVILALPDSAEFVGAFFGALKIGAVVVMVNPHLKADAISYFYEYTRAKVAVVHDSVADEFADAAGMDDVELAEVSAASSVARAADPGAVAELDSAAAREPRTRARWPERLLVVGDENFDEELAQSAPELAVFPSHRDDAAIWLFSGGTTGKPKAVVQSHASFVNTTELYAKGVIGYGPDDVTLSVPKLFFGYATGSNLLFPFAVGGCAVLFAERCTAAKLFELIERHRPTILINVPTMIRQMLDDETAAERDLSCLRLATSAGEALPVDLHRRWNEAWGVELLDGLGTAEQWHVFISNRPGNVRPGTLGQAVPGFEVKVADEDGTPVADGEIGWLWVRGDSRAIGYWQRMERTQEAFRGPWYVSGDMVRRDADGFFTYCGRGDDMLKVSGKWLSPGEVENCLLRHAAVADVAVVGVELDGLTKPAAFVVPAAGAEPSEDLVAELQAYVRDALEPYKYPRRVEFLDELPRTHLGKVDRGRLRELAG